MKRNTSIRYILAIIWCHTLLFTIVPIFGWSRYTPESFGVSCSIAWFDNSAAVLANNIAIVIGCYCIHVIIFTFCYSNIIRTFSKTSTTVARLREEIITDAHTLKLESMLKYHKILTYRKVTLVSIDRKKFRLKLLNVRPLNLGKLQIWR